jgi:hypothetical protein
MFPYDNKDVYTALREGHMLPFKGDPPKEACWPTRPNKPEPLEEDALCEHYDRYMREKWAEPAVPLRSKLRQELAASSTAAAVAYIRCRCTSYMVPARGNPVGRLIMDYTMRKLTDSNGANSMLEDDDCSTELIPRVRVKLLMGQRLCREQRDGNYAHLIQEGCIDIKSYFMNFPIHVLSRPLLGFMYRNKVTNRMEHARGTRAMFGLKMSPKLCCTYSAAVWSFASMCWPDRFQDNSMCYVDDNSIMTLGPDAATTYHRYAQSIHYFGLPLGLSTEIGLSCESFGWKWVWEDYKNWFYVAGYKRPKMEQRLQQMCRTEHGGAPKLRLTLEHMNKLLGRLTYCRQMATRPVPTVKAMQMLRRELTLDKKSFQECFDIKKPGQMRRARFFQVWKHGMPVGNDNEIRREAEHVLQWLVEGMPVERFRNIPEENRYVFYCDSSDDTLAGWWVHMATAWIVPLGSVLAGIHITGKETLAVVESLTVFGESAPPGPKFCLGFVDNSAVVQISEKGRAKTIGMALCHDAVLQVLRKYDIVLQINWISTVNNHLADKCTRGWDRTSDARSQLMDDFAAPEPEWLPHKAWGEFGTPTHDPVVTQLTYRDDEPLGVNAFVEPIFELGETLAHARISSP